MANAKYKKIFEEIWKNNKKLFQDFFLLNSEYSNLKKRITIEKQFQTVGKKVRQLLLEGEHNLCKKIENTNNRVFSTKLSDKYWDEARKYFKYIDMVGVKSSK